MPCPNGPWLRTNVLDSVVAPSSILRLAGMAAGLHLKHVKCFIIASCAGLDEVGCLSCN